jgi:regulator of replication initiation timing
MSKLILDELQRCQNENDELTLQIEQLKQELGEHRNMIMTTDPEKCSFCKMEQQLAVKDELIKQIWEDVDFRHQFAWPCHAIKERCIKYKCNIYDWLIKTRHLR